jgi:meso-butanediol dehydrogenase/(S,S)-butanediol dehydrogenase/diacetyl reductase
MLEGRLHGKTVLVTGAAGAIGKGLVLLFLRHGAFVAWCDIKGTAEFAAELQAQGYTTFSGAVADVGVEREVADWVESVARARGGRIDGVVNNAALFEFGNAEEATGEQWERAMRVNVVGYAMVVKYAVPHMKQHGGSIVQMSSQSAFIAQPGFTPYNTSKAAIEMLSKCVAQDYGRFGIRSNTVCPGTIETAATKLHAQKLGLSLEQFREETCKELFVKRLGTVEDVAHCALFLLSDESTYVTGAHLSVDGGNTAH